MIKLRDGKIVLDYSGLSGPDLITHGSLKAESLSWLWSEEDVSTKE